MSAQGKEAARLVPVPTCFDLQLGLSRVLEEAGNAPGEDDFLADVGGLSNELCLGGKSSEERNAPEGGRETGVLAWRVPEPEKVRKEVQKHLMTDGGSSEAECDSRKKRSKSRKLRRNKKRKFDAEEQSREDGMKGVALKRLREMMNAGALTSTDARGEDMKAAEGGWLGSLRGASSQEEESDLQRLLGNGFKLIKWDGRWATLVRLICSNSC